MLTFDKYPFLAQLGLKAKNFGASLSGTWVGDGEWTTSYNPNTGEAIAKVKLGTLQQYEQGMQELLKVKNMWAELPIPRRGDIVRQIGDEFRKQKEALGMLVALEMGKIKSEGLGEVQEIIDICDMGLWIIQIIIWISNPIRETIPFYDGIMESLGCCRHYYSFQFSSCRHLDQFVVMFVFGKEHHQQIYHQSLVPTSFMKFLKEMDCQQAQCSLFVEMVFKLEKPLQVIREFHQYPLQVPLKLVKSLQQRWLSRLARSLLELGGNNAQIVHEDANVDLALKAAVFAAVGTCGQRCTSLRRLLLHNSIAATFIQKMVKVYGTIKIGNALNDDTLCGPLHTKGQVEQYKKVIPEIQAQGGKLLYGGNVIEGPGNFVQPTIFEVKADHPILQHELFMPILFIVRYDTLDEAIEINNNVPQGLSSSLFTSNLSNSYKWTGPLGSDCGIVNVNIGTSGAEIGGAFGGEKETGGGRESGSDSWKTYMRRSTCTINFGKTLPLAQGVKFDI
ncbi:unnamed protein product (macronuclear) [Paramecium tetraurelia]|uniref:aldehyde dehydrogenase (NAD(+)) n=1 Tax=Paramecium tetraurelia TaxID=5888 RepID=A0C8Z9_PARTE|nr:uncharacterized protein GSPATT00006572001 [Paramecium tetraurelia]CAK67266.1 unnamed protein product [Paramecium tetraurelia]|eukprot:XP_001434663.1 hypothetical protein (macronuclear) [Paramecium tetraurelia strain d4-2]